ncbi:MAG TPA: hypothetical protein VF737_13390 [Gemmatimonadaceae bacterium]
MSEDEFRTGFGGSPMKRAKLAGMRAAVARRRYRFFGTTCGGADWSLGVQTLRQSSPALSGWQRSTCNALSVKTDRSTSTPGAAAGADRWL